MGTSLNGHESEMSEVVNLRTARKRATREKAARTAAENRLAHGASKAERARNAADRNAGRRMLDLHRIEPGDEQ